jgi:imidazole glycerol-phosphate synthase subunit HisF
MLKKRLIFVLHWDSGSFILSRNFSLQTVGNLKWIQDHYDFDSISTAIDELVVLNVSRENKDIIPFSKALKLLTKNCFMPLAAGGGIRKTSDAKLLLNSGADKIILNSSLFENQQLIRELVNTYGSQCIVASIDYREENNKKIVYTYDGTKTTGFTVEEAIEILKENKVGEIILNSIDQDGTGGNYDVTTIKRISNLTEIPLIPLGGAGKPEHFINIINECNVNAVATANLFYFMSDGLKEARKKMVDAGIDMAKWG